MCICPLPSPPTSLQTLGSLLRTFAFGVLLFKTLSQKSNAGLSNKTLQAYAAVFILRLCSILVYEGYLPYDKSGDWFYQASELASLGLVVYLLWSVATQFPHTYNKNVDIFGDGFGLPSHATVLILVGPAVLIGLFLHPTLNGNFLTDTAWATALYIEAVAILPQLLLLQRRGGHVDDMLANYVFALGAARVMTFVFWLSSHHELNDRYSTSFGASFPGYAVLLAQLIHLALMGNFMFLYLESARRGHPMQLPLPS